ncbi:hypothetical protein N9V60_04055 [Flavobacteriaceae bacterium]|nr:hypothetical protein [Flavobacteriaceae bacterium]MDB2340637.1 hypothetical protein [Flavobacteriaceae bacterium]MDC0874890.1 hypothetical protein [Flavobacteriaceae bacterium]
MKLTLSGAYEFNINEYERSVIPRHSYLLLYGSLANFNNAQYLSLSEEVQFGEFSLGISQQLSNVETINLNNIGMSVGLSLENFDFGIFYNFPIRQASRVFHLPFLSSILSLTSVNLEEIIEDYTSVCKPIIIFSL